MKTFQQFTEATEADLKAMGGSDAQIAAVKKRQEKRGYGFESNDDRNSSAPAKTQSSVKPTETTATNSQKKIKMGGTQWGGQKRAGERPSGQLDKYNSDRVAGKKKKDIGAENRKANASATAPAPKTRTTNNSTSIVPVSGSSRTSKEAIGAPKTSNRSGSKTYDRMVGKRKKPKGGDLMAPDEAKARREREINKKLDKEEAKKGRLGRYTKSAGNAVKNVAGKTFSALTKPGKSGEDVETGKESGNISGGSEYISRTKRG